LKVIVKPIVAQAHPFVKMV